MGKNSNDDNSSYFCSHCPNRSKATLKQIQSPPSPRRLQASCCCLRCLCSCCRHCWHSLFCNTDAIAVTVAATILPLLSTSCHNLLVEWAATEPPTVLHVTRPPSESEFCCICIVATSPKTACHVPKSVTPLQDIVASGKVPGHTGWMGASFHLLFAAKPGH